MMSRSTGRILTQDAHLSQSIADILTTPIGSRVMRRDYGSDLPRLVDAPMNGEKMVDIFAATAEALEKWEPRFILRRVEVPTALFGAIEIVVTGDVAGLSASYTAQVIA